MKDCWMCKYAKHYYKGKNQKTGCLKMAFCTHHRTKDKGKNGKWIASYRWDLTEKIKTHPRWCPIQHPPQKKGG